MSVETLLKELENNICNDYLNACDRSVGIEPVCLLDELVIKELNESDDITVLRFDKCEAFIRVEGYVFKIFYSDHDEAWRIKTAV